MLQKSFHKLVATVHGLDGMKPMMGFYHKLFVLSKAGLEHRTHTSLVRIFVLKVILIHIYATFYFHTSYTHFIYMCSNTVLK